MIYELKHCDLSDLTIKHRRHRVKGKIYSREISVGTQQLIDNYNIRFNCEYKITRGNINLLGVHNIYYKNILIAELPLMQDLYITMGDIAKITFSANLQFLPSLNTFLNIPKRIKQLAKITNKEDYSEFSDALEEEKYPIEIVDHFRNWDHHLDECQILRMLKGK